MIEKYKKSPSLQIISLFILVAILFTRSMSIDIDPINSATFAFSYKYGFLSRGMMGTIFEFFCHLFPNMDNPNGLIIFIYILTTAIYILILFLIQYCYKKVPRDKSIYLTYITYFLIMVLISTYVSSTNLGRLDVFCLMFSIISCFFIVRGKNIWICIPCAIMGTLIHQGYVFMYVNIVLALLLFCVIKNRDNKRKNYLIVLVLTFVFVSAIFLYSEFFSHEGKEIYYDVIVNRAGYLNRYGFYHGGIIDKELLGINQSEEEKGFMLAAIKTMSVFLVMIIPYIVTFIKFAIKLLKSSKDKSQFWSYAILLLGSATLLPEYLLKCDYGRWTTCIVVYYIVTILVASTIDNNIIDVIRDSLIPKKIPSIVFMMFYICLFIPFNAIVISPIPAKIAILFGI